VDDRSTELTYVLERFGQVCDGEIGKASRIAGTRPTVMDAQAQVVGLGLPPRSGSGGPWREVHPEDSLPEAARAIGIVGREFDQGRGHGREVSPLDRARISFARNPGQPAAAAWRKCAN
jgi:hypothetical protein